MHLSLGDFIWLKRGLYTGKDDNPSFVPAVPPDSQVDTGLPIPENLANQLPAQDAPGWYPSPEYGDYGDSLNSTMVPNVDGAKPGCCSPYPEGMFVVQGTSLESSDALTTAENLNLDPGWAFYGSAEQNVMPDRQWGNFLEETDQTGVYDEFGLWGLRGLGKELPEPEYAIKKRFTLLSKQILAQSTELPVASLSGVEAAAKALISELAKWAPWTAGWFGSEDDSQVIRSRVQQALLNVRIRRGTTDGSTQGEMPSVSKKAVETFTTEVKKNTARVGTAVGKTVSNAGENVLIWLEDPNKQKETLDTVKVVTYVVLGVAAAAAVGYALTSAAKAKEVFVG